MNQKYSKQEILLKGIFLLRRNGYHNTGIDKILKECKIPKGSFYNFFSNKKEFGLQALDLYGRSMLKLIQQSTQNKTLSPLERIGNYFEITLIANEEEGMLNGCLSMNFATELSGIDPDFAKKNQEIFDLWIEELGICIEEGQQIGEIIDRYTARELASYLYMAVFGAFARGKSIRDVHPLRLVIDTTLDFMAV